MSTVQKRMRSVMPETEEEASIAYDLKAPVVSSIINERSQNKWGIPQGYRIQVRSPPRIQAFAGRDGCAHIAKHISNMGEAFGATTHDSERTCSLMHGGQGVGQLR